MLFYKDPDGDNLMNAYRNLGFNTVVISDHPGINDDGWIYMTEAEIETAILQARKYNMNIILSLIAQEFGDQDELTGTQLAERFALWMKYDKGDIIGLYMVGDDIFLGNVPASRQIEWRSAVRSVSTDVPVFGILGEVSLTADEEDRDLYFSPWAYDHLLVMSYPFNLTHNEIYGQAILDEIHIVDPTVPVLDSTSPTIETDLRNYYKAYFTLMNERFISKMQPGKRVVPVIEAFKYTGAAAGEHPEGRDILQTVDEVSTIVRDLSGDDDWAAMTYFHWGQLGDEPSGMVSHREWWDSVKLANSHLQRSACIRTSDGVLARYVLGVK